MQNKWCRWPPVLFTVAVLLNLPGCSGSGSEDSQELGLWQGQNGEGSIEFKADGQVIILDNMDGRVEGHYQRGDTETVMFELTHTNILEDELKGMEPIRTQATMIIENDKLTLHVEDEENAEIYKRVRD